MLSNSRSKLSPSNRILNTSNSSAKNYKTDQAPNFQKVIVQMIDGFVRNKSFDSLSCCKLIREECQRNMRGIMGAKWKEERSRKDRQRERKTEVESSQNQFLEVLRKEVVKWSREESDSVKISMKQIEKYVKKEAKNYQEELLGCVSEIKELLVTFNEVQRQKEKQNEKQKVTIKEKLKEKLVIKQQSSQKLSKTLSPPLAKSPRASSFKPALLPTAPLLHPAQFIFSPTLKSPKVIIFDQCKIKRNQDNDGLNHFILLQPSISTLPSPVTIQFKILQRNCLQLGISSRSYLEENNYKCFQTDEKQGYHMSFNGRMYSLIKEQHYTDSPEFSGFNNKNVVKLVYDREEEEMRVCNVTKNQEMVMKVPKGKEKEDMYFCVGLMRNYYGSIPEIELMGNE